MPSYLCGSAKGHGKLQSLICCVDMFNVGLKQALHMRHCSVDTTVWIQLARWIWALMLTAPSSMADSLPTELLSSLRLENTGAGAWLRNNLASSGLPNHIGTGSVLYPDSTGAQGWQITNIEIHLRDKPLLFWCISVLASAESLKTHCMISYSRNNSIFLVVTAFFTWLASRPKPPLVLCRRVRSQSC